MNTAKQSQAINSRQGGFSLVELMVTLVISSVLIGGVFATYLNTTQTERFAQALSRLQESGRFGINYLAKEIRMVGFRGCASFDDVILNVIAKNAPSGADLFQNELVGFEANASTWTNGTQYESDPIAARLHTDIINIRRSSHIDVTLDGNMSADNANIQITPVKNNEIKAGDLIMISDCVNGDLFGAITISGGASKQTIAHGKGTINKDNKLSKAYQDDARIYKFTSISFFVGDTGRETSRGEPIYALYQAQDGFDGKFNKQEIIEGVENIQILYGALAPDNTTKYLNATQINAASAATGTNQWANVASVQIAMLIASNDSVRQSDDSTTYKLPGADIVAGTGDERHEKDRRLRQVYTTKIVIRNRQ